MSLLLEYWSISSQVLCEEAEALWLEIDIVNRDKNLFYVVWKGKEILFKSTDFWENSALWFKICLDKRLTYDILERNDFPIAKSIYVQKQEYNNFENTLIQWFTYPLVVKPLSEGHGDGVMMGIWDYDELLLKLSSSFDTYDNMIVQEQIEGSEIRVVVVKWEVILAINRIPAGVKWDGIHTLRQLIQIENESEERNDGYETHLSTIDIDDELHSFLEKNDMSLSTIPIQWKTIQLRGNSNLGTGGSIEEVSSLLSENTKKICRDIATLLWLSICWIDLIMKDMSQDMGNGNGIILEVWATPGIGSHRECTQVNTGREILKRVFNIT